MNTLFSVYALPNGKILRTGSGDLETASAQARDGEGVVFLGSNPSLQFVDKGSVVDLPSKPSDHHIFNYTKKQWEDPRTLQDIKDARRAYVNAERLKANQAYFTHEGKQIAADALSRGDIDAINGEINNTGAFPGAWPGAWKCLDNTWLQVGTVESWKALYTSMVNQGTANFGYAQALKAQIEAATSQAEVEAVVW